MVQRNQQCLQCDFKTTKKASLQTHTKSLHEGQKFQCSLCGSAFAKPSNLQKHSVISTTAVIKQDILNFFRF